MTAKIYVDFFNKDGIEKTLLAAFDWIDVKKIIFSGARVYIKLNFTYPSYKEGVTTSPAMIEAAVKLLSDYTPNITLVESNGGNNAWMAEETFVAHNLPALKDRYGVNVVNLSNGPKEMAETLIGGKPVRVELPAVLLHESDVFITMPVPKVHVMTRISYAFKNQWGCIPVVQRYRYHPKFNPTVLAINKLLKTRIAIYDGTYFLDRTGPMEGIPVPMNLLMVADDPGAGDLACCEIMGFNPSQVAHLRLAQKVGMMPVNFTSVALNQPLDQFKIHKFTLQRNLKHYLSLIAFNSDLLLRMISNPTLAKPIYKVFYGIFGKPRLIDPESSLESPPKSY